MIKFQAFQLHYSQQYGEKWQEVYDGLCKPTRYSCLINKYSDPLAVSARLSETKVALTQVEFIKTIPCLQMNNSDLFPQPARDENGIVGYYPLDAASVLAVEALNVQPLDRVLDLCSAPGGKALAVAQRLNGGSLVCNEMSSIRHARLKRVVKDYLPIDVQTTTFDGTQIHHYYQEEFDRIFIDAPCSSERHLIHSFSKDPKVFEWNGSKSLQHTQVKLVTSALKALKPGGHMIYATCSISQAENDDVIEKVLAFASKQQDFSIAVQSKKWKHSKYQVGQKTKFGWIILPHSQGYGPLYFSLLVKQ